MKLQSIITATGDLPEGPSDALPDALGDLAGTHVLLLGLDVAVMCALIRRGCAEVAELEPHERPEAHRFDRVIVPTVASADAALRAVAHARRALLPPGSVLLWTDCDPTGQIGETIRRALRLQGFSLIRVRRAGTRTIFTAMLSTLGPRPLALGEAA
jgi:hypothetical protein